MARDTNGRNAAPGWVVMAAISLTMSACTNAAADEPSVQVSPSATPSPSTTNAPPTNPSPELQPEVEELVEQATAPPAKDTTAEITDYFQRRTDEFFPAVVAGLEPDDPVIARFYAEPIRSRWQESIAGWKSKSERVEGTVSFAVLSIEHNESDRAEALVCYLDGTNIFTADGKNRSPAETEPRVHRYSLQRAATGSHWLMSEQTLATNPDTGASPWLCKL